MTPDMATYAKSIGNGYPVAAFGGRYEIMDIIGKGVAHGGTFAGNVMGAAAVDATLGLLQEQPILETIRNTGANFRMVSRISSRKLTFQCSSPATQQCSV